MAFRMISPFGSSVPADIEAARANQMEASAMPVDLNAVASPQWQRYFNLLKTHGINLGGRQSHFDPTLGAEQDTQGITNQLAGVGKQFHGFGQRVTELPSSVQGLQKAAKPIKPVGR